MGRNQPQAVRIDVTRRLILVWFGGCGVFVYDEYGNEISMWTLGPGVERCTEEHAVQSMQEAMKEGDYRT